MPESHEESSHEEFDLDALFASDAPPVHDADFVVAVAGRVTQRRLMGELAMAALWTGVAALILWAVGPVLAPALRPISMTALMFMPILATVAGVLIVVHPRTSV